MSMRTRVATLCLAAAFSACSSDSAGDVPAGDAPEATWRVEATPILAVGKMDGDDAELFVRVGDAARLPDGGLVVLDADAQELRFFGPGGALTRVSGRAGAGPGEFRGLFAVELVGGDSVVAWDFARGVLSYWSPSGEFLTERPAGTHRTIHNGALLPDGSLVVPRHGGEDPPAWGRYRPSGVLIRYGRGEPRDLGPFPYEEMFSGTRDGAPMPFAARSAMAAGGSPMRILVGDDSNVPRVRVYDDTGALVGEMALHDTRIGVTPGRWEQELDRVRERFGESPELERKIAAWGRPDSTPAYDDLEMDSAGRLWVLRREGQRLLATVHADGERAAEIELPELAEIYEIGDDYIVGLHRDSLDVESVRVYSHGST